MSDAPPKTYIRWTPLIDAHVRLLAALEVSYVEIAKRLGCDRRTISNRIGPAEQALSKTEAEILDLFETYDTLRSITQAIESPVASVELTRLRAGLRARRHIRRVDNTPEATSGEKELSDEEVCAELERLVGRPFKVEEGS